MRRVRMAPMASHKHAHDATAQTPASATMRIRSRIGFIANVLLSGKPQLSYRAAWSFHNR